MRKGVFLIICMALVVALLIVACMVFAPSLSGKALYAVNGAPIASYDGAYLLQPQRMGKNTTFAIVSPKDKTVLFQCTDMYPSDTVLSVAWGASEYDVVISTKNHGDITYGSVEGAWRIR